MIDLELDPAAMAQVAQIKRDASVWASMNPFSKPVAAEEDYTPESAMSPEEREAMLAGRELDDLQLSPDKNVEPGMEAELYEQHMRTMAADLGVETEGMNIDQLTDAVQVAHNNPEAIAQNDQLGANALANFLNADITTRGAEQGQEMNLAEIEAAGVPTVGVGQGQNQSVQIG